MGVKLKFKFFLRFRIKLYKGASLHQVYTCLKRAYKGTLKQLSATLHWLTGKRKVLFLLFKEVNANIEVA